MSVSSVSELLHAVLRTSILGGYLEDLYDPTVMILSQATLPATQRSSVSILKPSDPYGLRAALHTAMSAVARVIDSPFKLPLLCNI